MIRLGYLLVYLPIVLMLILLFNPGSYLSHLGFLTIVVWAALFFISQYGRSIVRREEKLALRRKNDGLN